MTLPFSVDLHMTMIGDDPRRGLDLSLVGELSGDSASI